MAKLTKIQKDEIIDRALKDTFEVRRQLLIRDKNLAAHALYEAIFPKEMRDKMKALPAGWLPTTTVLRINNFKNPPTPEPAPYLYKRFSIEPAVLITAEIQLDDITINYSNEAEAFAVEGLVSIISAIDNLGSERGELKSAIQQLIYPVTTEKRLIEIWPEGVKYMTPINTAENLPAVTSTQVVELMAKFKEKRP